MTSRLRQRLVELDGWIREGRTDAALEALTKLVAGKVEREAAARLAWLCWRASAPALGARLLARYVRPPGRRVGDATGEEKAEYAACLIKLGAPEEAEALLQEVDASRVPSKLLYEAFARVACWDYAGSIAPLRRYLAAESLTPYQRFVGKVNLAAALVEERHHAKAKYLLRELLHELSVRGHRLLLTRALLLAAENMLSSGRWDEAEAFLRKEAEVLGGSQNLDGLFLRKFQAFCALRRSPHVAAAGNALAAVAREAAKLGHWETVRDCDRMAAIARKDRQLAHHVYFGTPYVHFRKRLIDDFGRGAAIPESYLWKVGPAGKAVARLDLTQNDAGELSGGSLKAGGALHRLLLTLCSDFYRPFRTATLHAALYPGEHFHPEHSGLRVRQMVKRLRRWLDERKLPLAITVSDSGYRLTAREPVELRVRIVEPVATRETFLVRKLRETLTDDTFSISDAALAWGLSRRSALRVLDTAVERGDVRRTGIKRGTRYHFAGAASEGGATERPVVEGRPGRNGRDAG